MIGMTEQAYNEKVYMYSSGEKEIQSEAQYGYTCEAITVDHGIYLHIQGMEYPEKGIAPARDIFAVNIVKKMIMLPLRLLPYLVPSVVLFAVIPFSYKLKILNKVIREFVEVSIRPMKQSLLQHQHLTPMAQELHKFTVSFMKHVGLSEHIQFVNIIINIINFDNAYRYRIQDIANETTKEMLASPVKEFRRLLSLNAERETSYPAVAKKFKSVGFILSFLLLHPKIRRAYLKALNDIDLSKIQPDEADKFWMCVRTNYNYFGKTDKERLMMINHLKYVIPRKIEMPVV